MEIELLKYPFPFRSMLAICSDLDETPSADEYFEISRYLNTKQKTRIGGGVGLEVGNTLYFDMPDDQFAYWNTTDSARANTRQLIQSGHIDCFHSFGDLALTRADAERSLSELQRHNCQLPIWVDHATAITNLGIDIMHGDGARIDTEAYHADLLMAHGVRYVWTGRVTSTLGQNSLYNPLHLIQSSELVASLKTTLKDVVKQALSYTGNDKYELHRGNRLFAEKALADGTKRLEFIRCNPNPGGVSVGEHSRGVAGSLNPRNLQVLSRRQGVCILYSHLGKHLGGDRLFPDETRRAFAVLANASSQQQVLVATSYRLLNYVESHAQVRATMQTEQDQVSVTLPEGLNADGMTFRTRNTKTLKLVVNGVEAQDVEHGPHPDGGYCTWIPWPDLAYPDV